MAEQDDVDPAPTRSVSSLRSRFENLANLNPPADDNISTSNSPRTSRFLDPQAQSPVTYGRTSLDLPRPQSPWRSSTGQVTSAEPTKKEPPQTPPSGNAGSPRRYGHSRPLSMSIASSPSFTPAVLVESPRSPPRGHLFTRSGSRSPDRKSFLSFSHAPSQPASAHTSRPSTPRIEDCRPISRRGMSEAPQASDKNGTAKGPPPPVNRADKPKIPAKPVPPLQVPAADTAINRNSMSGISDPRISPFSTPPGSDGSPSPERITQGRIRDYIEPRLSSLSDASKVLQRNQSPSASKQFLLKDPRFLGFSSKTTEMPERPSLRTAELSSTTFGKKETSPIRNNSASSPVSIPQRPNTLPVRDAKAPGSSNNTPVATPLRRSQDTQRPLIPASNSLRDPKKFGLSSESLPLPQKSEDISRPFITTPDKRSQSPARSYRDPRTLGFSSATTASTIEPTKTEPSLPPRRVDSLPPPRPSEASKSLNLVTRKNTVPPSIRTDRQIRSIPSQTSVKPPENVLAPASHFPPPPKRNTFPESVSGEGQRKEADYSEDSDDAEESMGDTFIPRTDYPDTTQANRRPPFFGSGANEIFTKHDARVFDVCGRYVCTSGFQTRVWDLTTGENIMSIGHGETTKTLSVVFKPAANLEDEGLRLWIGNNVGDLHEIDIATQGVVASSSAHNRREVIKIFRHKKNLWSLDEDGKLCVWKADETGSPNLNYSHHLHKVQKGYTFGIVVGDYLWFATGKDLYVYKPGNNTGFQVLQKPLNQPGAGEITSGTFPGANSDRVYFGYTDGKVAIYNTKDYSCIASVKASDYKINAMVMTENLLWAAYKTGKIYVYDTSSSPWKVQKDWRAHEAPVFGLLLDLSGIWTLNRLHIVSLGQDNCIRSWDGMLKDDWIESQMHQRDIEYCRFREIRASIITWNVGASSPYDVPGGFLRDAIHVEDPPELLIFGFQELVDLEDRTVTAKNILGFGKKKDPAKDQQHVSKVYREWRDYLGKCINQYMDVSVSYTELHTSSLIGLFLCVFVRQDQKRSIRGINAAEVKCGMKGRYGNKGALILRFTYDDSSLCFVNCHLAAGQTQTSHRNNDVATILEAEALPGEANLDVRTSTYVGGGDGTQILDHEICVLNGDLNYRIDAMPRNTVIEYIKRNDLGKLLERDQIMVSRRRVSGFRLSPFVEAPITFAPTYKYDVGTDNYDTSEKKRSPAWCDRLLYRGPGRIKQLEYRRHEVRISDHRPVSGAFRMRVKTIDPRQRSAVLDDCLAGFSEVKRKMAANASVDYLVLSMGLEAGEARKLISQG